MKKTLGNLKKAAAMGLLMLMCVGCDNNFSEEDGNWDEMKWEKVNYETTITSIEIDKKKYDIDSYIVPAKGGVFTFKCKNYNGFWLNHAGLYNEQNWIGDYSEVIYPDRNSNDFHSIKGEWIKVKADGNVLTVEFSANTGKARYAEVHVTAGDIFDSFRFSQTAGN